MILCSQAEINLQHYIGTWPNRKSWKYLDRQQK